MEGIIISVVIFVVLIIVSQAISAGGKADSSKTELFRMGEFEVKVIPTTKQFEEQDFEVFEVQVRGIIPVSTDLTKCSIYIQLFDCTDGNDSPVYSFIEEYSETSSKAFGQVVDLGAVALGSGYENWITITNIVVDTISLPYSGEREIFVQLCVVPTNDPPLFHMGIRSGETGNIFGEYNVKLKYNFTTKGYLEHLEERQEVEELTIDLAFCIAASDGNIASEEGTVIKEWANELLNSYHEDNKQNHKDRFNKAIRYSFDRATNNKIDIHNVTSRINEIASATEKYDAIELCLDVMKADNVVDSSELNEINNIAKMLDLEFERFRALQDRRLADVENIDTTKIGVDQILGIEPDMDLEEIRKHLASEYRKWNSRVNSGDPNIREQAKQILILIGKARSEYIDEESNKKH